MPGNDSFTKVLLHFDGNLNDVAAGKANAHSWSGTSGASIDSGNFKFGNGSGNYPNLSTLPANCHTCAENSDFDFGSGDFTVDFWFKVLSGTPRSAPMAGQRAVSETGWSVQTQVSGANVVVVGNALIGGLAKFVTGTTALATDTWHHVAWVRSGGTLYLFANGNLEGTTSCSGAIQTLTGNLSVGRWGDLATGNGFNGWVDEFRLSVGIARWTTNFTPPTAAYDSVTNFTVNSSVSCATSTTIKASRLILALIAVHTAITLRKSALKLIAIAVPALVTVSQDIARIVRNALYKVRAEAPNLDRSRANSSVLQKSRASDPVLDE